MTRVTIDAGLLQMITNGLRRDVADGKVIRGEWLAEIEKDAELEQNTFPLNPNAASKWAHLQKHDGAEAIGVVFRTGSGSVGSLVDGRVVWADWLAHPNGSKPESVNAELLEADETTKRSSGLFKCWICLDTGFIPKAAVLPEPLDVKCPNGCKPKKGGA